MTGCPGCTLAPTSTVSRANRWSLSSSFTPIFSAAHGTRGKFGPMANTETARSGRLADQFEAALENFVRVVDSLTNDQWRMRGRNTPGMRINDEDEARPLGVIAHHVAVNEEVIMGRIEAVMRDARTQRVDFKEINAKHANEYADTTKDAVVSLLRDSGREIAKHLRA